jgi:hypothetical protein
MGDFVRIYPATSSCANGLFEEVVGFSYHPTDLS